MDSSSMNIIKYLSGKYAKIMPSGSLHTFDDLVQWGLIIDEKCKKEYDPERGALYTTYLYRNLVMKFNVILKYERAKKRNKDYLLVKKRIRRASKDRRTNIWKAYSSKALTGDEADYHLNNTTDETTDPERLAMFKEVLEKIRKINPDFALMIVNGLPKELTKIAKRYNRSKRLSIGRDATNGSIMVTKGMIEDFFGINLDEIKELFYNYYNTV